ncbi:cold-shock protein [Xanthomarina spongicola]|uniref:CspA family cold shock protein n=1 Tax=Xanthomarina spongicola TaxID=570520 RepID=A0A316DQ37_9FLAO|nr:cold shock domain-containing protein [Xanthomarina spongicola]PWK19886.1 CspA family cold shock protein [Xanthomarina spongicola]
MIKKILNRFIKSNKASQLKEGNVKFFIKAKGFGFITVKDSEKEIFVHSTNLIDTIKENDHVKFDIEQGEKGLIAVKVSLV